MVFSYVSDYLANFENYTDGEDDFFDYYFLTCEQTARHYAASAVEDYYLKLEHYYGTEEWSVSIVPLSKYLQNGKDHAIISINSCANN